MKDGFYCELQNAFVKIRYFYSSDDLDRNGIDAALGELNSFKKQLEKYGAKNERKVLIYCIDTLVEMIGEGNREKVFAFADLIHNIPEVFIGKRSFRSFGGEIKRFNEEFRESCFSDMDCRAIDASKAASPKSKKASRRTFWFFFFTISAIIAFCLPLILYIVYMLAFAKPQNIGGWPILAFFGCIAIGVGLFNAVFSFIYQFFSHKITAACLIGGGVGLALSVFMTHHPELYDADVSFYYFLSLALMLMPIIFYVLFRLGVERWLKRVKKIGSSRLKNLTKGIKNFWWYEELHKQKDLGAVYHFNKIFTVFYVLTLALTLIFGFIKEMALFLCPVHVILCLLTAFSTIFSTVQDHMDFHGTPIVLFAKGRRPGVIDSVFFDAFFVLFALIPAVINILLVIDLFGA